MTNISSVDPAAPGRVASIGDTTARSGTRADQAAPVRSDDRAEFSTAAQLLSRLRALPEVRQDLIDEVRARIDAGGYDTPEKLDAALEEMIRDAEEI